jgi:hypothetical protein
MEVVDGYGEVVGWVQLRRVDVAGETIGESSLFCYFLRTYVWPDLVCIDQPISSHVM